MLIVTERNRGVAPAWIETMRLFPPRARVFSDFVNRDIDWGEMTNIK